MFGLSFWEIAVILVVALLALGPEKLPKLLKTIGRGMREVRRASNELRSAIEEPLEELKAPLQEMRDGLFEGVASAKRQIEDEARRIEADGADLMGLDEHHEHHEHGDAEHYDTHDTDDEADDDEHARVAAAIAGEREHASYLAEHDDAVLDDLFDDPEEASTRLVAEAAPTQIDTSAGAAAAAHAGEAEEARTEITTRPAADPETAASSKA